MAEKRILKENGVDIIPITHETAVVTNEGTTINQKYATKEEVNAQIQEESEAINSRINTIDAKVGDLNALQTSNKSSLTSAINELFQRGNSVKQKLVDTLIAKDVEASTNETFQNLLNKFNEIEFTSNLPASAEGDCLYPIADLPTATLGGDATSNGIDSIYYIGGATGTSSSGRTNCYRYDVNENIWYSIASLPIARTGLSVTYYNGYVYAIGGNPGSISATSGSANTNYRYDPITNSWTSLVVLPSTLTFGTCEAYNGSIYFLGGRSGAISTASRVTYCYDITSNSWSTKTQMTSVRYLHASTVVSEGYIDVIGGCNSNGYSQTTHYQYNIASNSWSTKTAMVQGIFSHDCESITNNYGNSEIYWFSGVAKSSSSTSYRNRTYYYSVAGNTNTQCMDFSLEGTIGSILIDYSCAVLDNKIYILGGTLNDVAVKTCQVYIPY